MLCSFACPSARALSVLQGNGRSALSIVLVQVELVRSWLVPLMTFSHARYSVSVVLLFSMFEGALFGETAGWDMHLLSGG